MKDNKMNDKKKLLYQDEFEAKILAEGILTPKLRKYHSGYSYSNINEMYKAFCLSKEDEKDITILREEDNHITNDDSNDVDDNDMYDNSIDNYYINEENPT